MNNFLTLIVAPILVGVAIALFDRWLDDQIVRLKLPSGSHWVVYSPNKKATSILVLVVFVLLVRFPHVFTSLL